MRRLATAPAGALAVALVAAALPGCLSKVNQDIVYGTAHPAIDAHATASVERRPAEGGGAECRRVVATAPMERDELTHRTFARPEAQAANLASFTLLGGSVAFLFYASDQANCPDNGGGCGGVLAAQIAAATAAAVPLGFLLYNAFKVRDTERVVGAAPERVEGPWAPCEGEAAVAWPGSTSPFRDAAPAVDAGASEPLPLRFP